MGIKGWKKYGFEGRAGRAKWIHGASLAEIELWCDKGLWNARVRRPKSPGYAIAAAPDKGIALDAVIKWMKKNPKG